MSRTLCQHLWKPIVCSTQSFEIIISQLCTEKFINSISACVRTLGVFRFLSACRMITTPVNFVSSYLDSRILTNDRPLNPIMVGGGGLLQHPCTFFYWAQNALLSSLKALVNFPIYILRTLLPTKKYSTVQYRLAGSKKCKF